MNAVAPLEALPTAPTRAQIERLEAAMLAQPQADCPVVHSFAPGLYVRQVTLKAGTYAIGHYQRTTHLNVMLAGRVTMIEGDVRVERVAPLTYVAGPGRKIGYIHEDVIWLNIYATEETDIATLEAMFLDKSEAWQQSRKTIAQDRQVDVEDFRYALKDLDVTAEMVRQQSENAADQVPFPPGSYGVKVGPSRIEGLGLIATSDFQPGQAIAPARIGGKRTPAGRYTNHALRPNAQIVPGASGDMVLVALTAIAGCRGGDDGEEITVDYRQVVAANRAHAQKETA